MLLVIFTIPLLSLLMLLAFALDEWEEERQKTKKEKEYQKRKKEFVEKHLTNRLECAIIYMQDKEKR